MLLEITVNHEDLLSQDAQIPFEMTVYSYDHQQNHQTPNKQLQTPSKTAHGVAEEKDQIAWRKVGRTISISRLLRGRSGVASEEVLLGQRGQA
jgi:hypothetical protein